MPKIQLSGRITTEGELQIEIPAGLPAGEARITIEIQPDEGWSAAELDQVLETAPFTGHQLVTSGLLGSWADQEISDSSEWVARMRRERRERQQ